MVGRRRFAGVFALLSGVGLTWFLGPGAATAQEDCCDWSPADCWYGDGADGTIGIWGYVTLTRDMNYRSLTINPGATLDTGGFVVRVCDTLVNAGEITDWQSGGEGGDGGAVPPDATDGPGRGGNPLAPGGGNPCRIGACGSEGDDADVGEAGHGGGGGCQGSGGDGALRDCLTRFDADGGWCTFCGDAEYNDNDRGKGGHGGRGGGYVRVWAFNINNTGHVHADGEGGHAGGEGGDGEYYAYPEPPFPPTRDLCGGGQGGGAGGDGGEGGTLKFYHPRPSDPLGPHHANGGQGGPGGPGGLGGTQAEGHALYYGIPLCCVEWPGCDPTCCEQCSPRPCWDSPGCNPCGGRGGDGECHEGFSCGDGALGAQGCNGPNGTAPDYVTRPGDYDGDGDEDVVDYYEFVECYVCPDGGPVTPGCDVFDFDCDGDIDPDDWNSFKIAWTGPPPGSPPVDACCIDDPGPGCENLHVVDCCLADGVPVYPPNCTEPQACCFDDGSCVMVDPLCADMLGCVLQGPGTVCTEPEACCLPDGTCMMLDPLCCDDPPFYGVPQGSGMVCTEPEACCFADGSCEMVDPLCADEAGCDLQGSGTSCGGMEACCDAIGLCYMADATCCLANDDTPQGPGTVCTAPEACCFSDDTCQMLAPLCCVEQDGAPQGVGSICGTPGYEWITSDLSWPDGAVEAGWSGWWFRQWTEWFDFTFSDIDTNLIDNFVTVEFHLGVTNRASGESGLDGLIDVVINPGLTPTTTYAYVLLDNIDPDNLVYGFQQGGSNRTFGRINVPKSYIIDGQLVVRVDRHADSNGAPHAPEGTEQPIDTSTWPPTVPLGVYEDDDAFTVHIGISCVDGAGGHIISCEGGSTCVAVVSDVRDVEGCCLPDGTCIDADALCCVNELGGIPQGAGSTCTTPEACCIDLTAQCIMVDPLCCDEQGGIAQGAGTECTVAEACCLWDGTCIEVDPLCCDELGGWLPGEPNCLGDSNGNLMDDACEPEGMKWVQLPDFEPFIGMDVGPYFHDVPMVFADDFLCTETGKITEVRVWGSWLYDMVPDHNDVMFRLSFHADNPVGPFGWSEPLDPPLWVWEFFPGEYFYELYMGGLYEGWYDPFTGFYEAYADSMCWQYTFPIPEDFEFIQEEGTIYWLDVQAFPLPPNQYFFGWKTSIFHFNDDAVWAEGDDFMHGPWWELRYPEGHPYMMESIDLAFMLFGEPVLSPPRPDPWEFHERGYCSGDPPGTQCRTNADCPAGQTCEDYFGGDCQQDSDCWGANQTAAYCVPEEGGTYPGVCYAPTNRYISIARDPTQVANTARRISLSTGLAGPWWVGPPTFNPVENMYFASVSPTSVYAGMGPGDWVGGDWPDVIHVKGCEIAPGVHTYLVQAIILGSDESDENYYSEALDLAVSVRWGDVVSSCFYGQCLPPTGAFTEPSIDDVLAMVNAFQGIRNAPLWWMDVDPVFQCGEPECLWVLIGDVLACVNAYQGQPYPGWGPDGCGGCPD